MTPDHSSHTVTSRFQGRYVSLSGRQSSLNFIGWYPSVIPE